MSTNHGWKGRYPKFDVVHVDTPERFVGVVYGRRISIAVGDMGMWECDVLYEGRYIVDAYLAAKNMDHAISQTLALADIKTDKP